MGTIVAVYVVITVIKWAYEALGWMKTERAAKRPFGVAAWWKANGLDLAEKGLLSAVLCLLWSGGWLLTPLNDTIGKLVQTIQGDQGVAIAPLFPAVTVQTTAAAAWILDSMGKPLATRFLSARTSTPAAPSEGAP